MTDKPNREGYTPVHNTGTFEVFSSSAREWAAKCREISRDSTREMQRVRLPAGVLSVKLEMAASMFSGWLREPETRPGVHERQPIVAKYQDLVRETISFLSGLTAAQKK